MLGSITVFYNQRVMEIYKYTAHDLCRYIKNTVTVLFYNGVYFKKHLVFRNQTSYTQSDLEYV